MDYGDPRYDEDEAFEFLRKLMPQGFAGPDVLAELAPEGWECSGLVRAYHPGVEQAHAEAVAMHENLERLRGLGRKRRGKPAEEEDVPLKRPPTLEEIRAEYKETPVRPEEECRDIVGCVLWEIFSDNHSVIADDGREVDLGSFRGASSTLDAFDRGEATDSDSGDWMDVWDRGDHMRFYCGLAFIAGRTDYRPVYEMVFRRLRALGADWIYRFPRLGVVRFKKPEEADDPTNYSPSEAFAKEAEEREKEAEFARMRLRTAPFSSPSCSQGVQLICSRLRLWSERSRVTTAVRLPSIARGKRTRMRLRPSFTCCGMLIS